MDWARFVVDFILHVDVHLISFVQAYGAWVYALLFAIVFIETGVVVMPFLPGDSLLFVVGTLCGLGMMNLPFDSSYNSRAQSLTTCTQATRSAGSWICAMALVGFQGRGCADGVQPDFCHALSSLKPLFFNSLKNGLPFSDNAGA